MTALVATSVNVVQDVEALKGQGVGVQQYGSATKNIVCGDRLCSEIPGGRAAFEGGETGGTEETVEEETMEETVEEEAMEETVEEEAMVTHDYQSASGTMTSMQDPGLGHESHQIAIILPPTDKVYKGIISYDASEPIQLVALHGPLGEGEDMGQPIWTPDGETKFALTFIDPEKSMGSWIFSGNALAVHTMNEDAFTVSYSVSYMENTYLIL
jgi:hypothetical protein